MSKLKEESMALLWAMQNLRSPDDEIHAKTDAIIKHWLRKIGAFYWAIIKYYGLAMLSVYLMFSSGKYSVPEITFFALLIGLLISLSQVTQAIHRVAEANKGVEPTNAFRKIRDRKDIA